MSTIYVDTVEPSVPAKDITLGATGDSITISGNSINTNVIKDSGGNVLFQSDGSGTLSNVNSAFSNNLKLLSTSTVSSATSSVSITSNIDSSYDVYIFKFYNVHCEDDDRQFSFQVSTDGGSSYGIAGTSTVFQAYHYEDNSATSLSYQASVDRANSTSYMNIGISMNNPADSSLDGELYLFAPSSTTYVKHWYATTQLMAGATGVVGPWSVNNFTAGYFNTTSAVDAIDFEFSSSSQMDNAVIKMYGL